MSGREKEGEEEIGEMSGGRRGKGSGEQTAKGNEPKEMMSSMQIK